MSAALARARTNDERTTKALARINSSAERATHIISDLLDLTRSRLGGGIPVTPRPCQLSAIAQEVLDEHIAAHPERRLRLASEGDTGGSWDWDRVAQALSNLVGNAIHHGACGSEILVRTWGLSESVCASVHNAGVPIPAEQLAGDLRALQGERSPAPAQEPRAGPLHRGAHRLRARGTGALPVQRARGDHVRAHPPPPPVRRTRGGGENPGEIQRLALTPAEAALTACGPDDGASADGCDGGARRRETKGRALNCPGCGARVAADEAICPHCDHIIDPSFLEGRSDRAAAEAASLPSASSAPTRGARRARAPDRGTGRRPAAAPATRPADDERTPSPPALSRRRELPARSGRYDPAPGPYVTGKVTAPDELFRDLASLYGNLGRSDRIAFFGAVALVLARPSFRGSRPRPTGDILGILSSGLLALAAGVFHLAAITIRVQRFMPRLNPLVPWLGQLFTAAFSVLWCLIFMRLAWDSAEVPSPIGNFTMMRSSPSIGAWVGLTGSIVALGGTLLGLKEKS